MIQETAFNQSENWGTNLSLSNYTEASTQKKTHISSLLFLHSVALRSSFKSSLRLRPRWLFLLWTPASHVLIITASPHTHTHFSPILFFPLYSALPVNSFSPKASVWLMPGLCCGPYFHPNCLTPTGTLRGVRLRSLLRACAAACTQCPTFYTIHSRLFWLFFLPHKITICALVGVRKYYMWVCSFLQWQISQEL